MPLWRAITNCSLRRSIWTSPRLASPAARRLDRQQPAVARRLRDVAGGRHLRAVEAAHQRAALVDLPHVAEEHGLMIDRAAGTMFADDGLDGLKRGQRCS
jgi:hypothetical protein